MEQVEYPGMSGTNTMCVVTVLLETGMLPMHEPVTELTLESPAGLIRVTRRVPRRQGRPASRSGTFRRSRPTSTRRSRCRSSARSRVDVAYGGMFYVIADAEPFGLRLTPDEGADIVRITEMIKAAAAEQLPVVHPDQPGFAGHHHRPAVRARPRPGQQPAERRDGLDRDAGLGAPGDLDRRHRSLAVRHRDVGQDGDAPREGPARASATTFRHEGILGTVFTGRCSRRRTIGPYRAIVPTITGQAWITGFARYVVDPTRPVPRRLHGRRHLGLARGRGSAQQVAPVERQRRATGSTSSGRPARRDAALARVDLDRRGRAVAGQVGAGQAARPPTGDHGPAGGRQPRPRPAIRRAPGRHERRRQARRRPPEPAPVRPVAGRLGAFDRRVALAERPPGRDSRP